MRRRVIAPTVVAEGAPGGWQWVLDACRAAQAPYRVYFQVRRRRGSRVETAPQLGDLPIAASFAQDPDGDGSVLFGPVSGEVEAVIVEPLRPLRAPARPAEIGFAEEFGCFFVMPFEEPVELASVRVEPAERFADASTFALNMLLRGRRQNAEAFELGRGSTPDGRRWRLRGWREEPETPDLLTVDLTVGEDDQAIERMYENDFGDGGYGGPPMPTETVMTHRMISRSFRGNQHIIGRSSGGDHHIVGELVPTVAQVKVVLDDATELDAQLVRTTDVDNDYFVAFLSPARQATELIALDERQQELARQRLDNPGSHRHP